MTQVANRPEPVTGYDAPAWLVTALGVSLGLIGLGHLITNPEPLWVWLLEGVLVVAPAAIIVYGGYWIATRSLDRADRWITAGWTLGGAVVAVALTAGHVLSEQFSGGLVTESGQLVIFGALGGSLVALLAVTSTQRRYHGPEIAYPGETSAEYRDRNRIDDDNRWETDDRSDDTDRIDPDEASITLPDHPFYGRIMRVEACGHRSTMIAEGGHIAAMEGVHPEWAIQAAERDGRFSVHRSSEEKFQAARRESVQGASDEIEG